MSEPRSGGRTVMWLIVATGVVVAIGLVIFVVVFLRDRPIDACADLLGPVDRIEQLAGVSLEPRGGAGGERDCDLMLWERGRATAEPAVTIANRPAGQYAATLRELDAAGRDRRPLTLARGEGVLYLPDGTPRFTLLLRHGELVTRIELDASLVDEREAMQLASEIATRLH